MRLLLPAQRLELPPTRILRFGQYRLNNYIPEPPKGWLMDTPEPLRSYN